MGVRMVMVFFAVIVNMMMVFRQRDDGDSKHRQKYDGEQKLFHDKNVAR